MNKPFKTLSTAALAAVFASSALVPVASAEVAPAQAASLSKIIVEYNGQNVALTVSDYSDLLDAGKINPATVKYVELSTGDKYTLDAYSEALDAFSNVEDTAEYLAEKGTPSEVKDVKDGTIKDGEIQVEDGTPSTEVKVESVKAINETTVNVTLTEKPATDLTKEDAAKFVVLANGETVAVSNVEKVASDLTGKTYKLTIASLTGKQGTLSVNGKELAVGKGKEFAFDYKAPTVVGVEAKGNQVIEVTFSEKVDPTLVNNTNIKVTKDGVNNAFTQIAVDASGTKAIITLTTPLTVAEYKVTFGTDNPQANLVKDVAGNAVYGGTEVKFTPTTEQLTVKEAAAITKASYNSGNGKLTVTFTKAVKDSVTDVTKFKVNDVALLATDVDVDTNANDNVVTFQLGATSKAAVNALTGELTLTAEAGAFASTVGTEDIKTTGATATIVKEAPAVLNSVSYNQESNLLTVTFDQPVLLATDNVLKVGTGESNAVQVTRANAVDAAGKAIASASFATLAQDTWTFNLGLTNVAGTLEDYNPTNETLKAFVAAAAVKNGANVLNLEGQETYAKGVKGTYVADETEPTVTAVAYNDFTKELTIAVSEKLNASGGLNRSKIKVYSNANNGTLVALNLNASTISATPSTDGKTYTLKDNTGTTDLQTALETVIKAGNKLSVVLESGALKDEANKLNKEVKYAAAIPVEVSDFTKPEFLSVDVKTNTHVLVNFSEKLDKATAEDVSNYTITGGSATDTLAVTAAVLQADGKSVLLTTAAQTAGKPYTFTVKEAIKDLAGNTLNVVSPAKTTGSFTGIATSATQEFKVTNAVFTTVANKENDEVVLTFDQDVDPVSAVNGVYTILKHNASDASDVWTNATAVSTANADVKVTGPKQVTITLKSDLTNDSSYRVTVQGVKDNYGNALTTSTATNVATGDVIAPKPSKVTQYKVEGNANDYVELVFDEELDTATVLRTNFVVDVDGDGATDVLSAAYTWDATAKKATVKLTLAKDFTVARAVNITGVKDIAGNVFTGAITAAEVLVQDTVKPSVEKAEIYVANGVADDVLAITFKEDDLLASTATNVDNYVIKDAKGNVIPLKGTDSKLKSPVTVDSNKKTVLFTFDSSKYNLLRSQAYTVEIKDVLDNSGQKIDPVTVTTVAAEADGFTITVDNVKPEIAATPLTFDTTSKSLGVTFGEALNADSAKLVANYTIEYSAKGDYSDTVTLTPILASVTDTTPVDGTTDDGVVTLNFAESLTKVAGAKVRVKVSNVMDAAGNVILANATKELTVAAQPGAPTAALNIAAGTITNITKSEEYSLDGGATWTTASDTTVNLSSTEKAALDATKDLLVRTKETTSAPAGLIQTIDIKPAPAASTNVTFDVATGVTANTATTQEYSVDGGTTWVTFGSDNEKLADLVLATLDATKDFKVRTKATADTLAGAVQTLDLLAGPTAPITGVTASFPAEATSINLAGLTASATNLEAAVATDGSTYGNYAALTVAPDGKATITSLTGVTANSKVKVRVKASGLTLPGTAGEFVVTAE